MATSWAAVIDEIRRKAPSLARTVAVLDLQRIINELDRQFWLTRDEQIIPFVANQARYTVDVSVLRVWDADVQYGNKNAPHLRQKSIRTFDQSESIQSRLLTTGSPEIIYLDPQPDGDRQVAFYPVPANTSLTLTGATNASPVVATSLTAHNLSDSYQVFIAGVLGNLAANGSFYADVLSSTTFALYSDSALTLPVAGTGAYTSGGVLATSALPFGRLHVSRKVTVSDSTNAYPPASMDDYLEGLIWGVLYEWWQGGRGAQQQIQDAKFGYSSAKGKLQRVTGGLLAQVKQETRPKVRQTYRVL